MDYDRAYVATKDKDQPVIAAVRAFQKQVAVWIDEGGVGPVLLPSWIFLTGSGLTG